MKGSKLPEDGNNTIQGSWQVWELKSAELAGCIRHSKDHGVGLPLQPVFNVQFFKEAHCIWICTLPIRRSRLDDRSLGDSFKKRSSQGLELRQGLTCVSTCLCTVTQALWRHLQRRYAGLSHTRHHPHPSTQQPAQHKVYQYAATCGMQCAEACKVCKCEYRLN